MTADEIRKRLDDLGLHPWIYTYRRTDYVGGRGDPAAWQKALGPTKEQAEEALWSIFDIPMVPEDVTRDVIGDILARLYP